MGLLKSKTLSFITFIDVNPNLLMNILHTVWKLSITKLKFIAATYLGIVVNFSLNKLLNVL